MRANTLFAMLMCVCAAMFVAPAITTGQPGKGKGGFGGGGFGGMTPDANKLFDYYSQGQPYVDINKVRWGRTQMLEWAQEKGITNGQLTRPQFLEYQESLKAKLSVGGGKIGFAPGGGENGGKKKFGDGGPGASPTPATPTNPGLLNQLADEQFKRHDNNNDNKLTPDEMPGSLRRDLNRWDKNGDGLIDQAEFRDYYATRLGGGGDDGGAKGIASIIIEEEELDRKTVVFRVGGKLPPGLPAWFKELDTAGDKDGQVALWEWKKGGKELDDFRTWDLNDDSYVTIDEATRVQAKANGKSSNGSGSLSETTSIYPSERPQFGGFGKGGFGKGGFGGKDWKGGKGKKDRDN